MRYVITSVFLLLTVFYLNGNDIQITLSLAFGEAAPMQGYTPEDTYTPSDMQTYHLDDLMTHPQPLRNPPEPKVHPTPGREATQPTY